MQKKSKSSRQNRQALYGGLYILPSFVLIIVFAVVPIFMSGYFSFTSYNVMNPPKWIGLSNYIQAFNDSYVTDSLKNTILYVVLTVPFQTIASLVFAAFLADRMRTKFGGFIRSSMFIPVIASAITAGAVWRIILATDGGIMNIILGLLHLPLPNWLGSSATALISVGIVAVWKNVGYFLVIYYAGIMGISKELIEAAEVDGATTLQKFVNITVPMLKPITYMVLTLGVIWSFQVFDLVYVMTGGGPGRSTITLVMTIYNSAFKDYKMGYASAVAMLLLIIILLVNYIQQYFFKERKGHK